MKRLLALTLLLLGACIDFQSAQDDFCAQRPDVCTDGGQGDAGP